MQLRIEYEFELGRHGFCSQTNIPECIRFYVETISAGLDHSKRNRLSTHPLFLNLK